MDVTFQTTKRKRSPRSEQALKDVGRVLHKTTRRPWRRQLDSSSSESISPPLSLHASATSDSSQPAAVPHSAPGPSGPSQCVEIDLFLTCSPAKTTPQKVSQGQRQGQNPGISSTIKTSSTKVSAGTNEVVGSPSTKTTPRKGPLSEKESQALGVTSSVKASRTVVKATRKEIGPKTTKGLGNERVSQTPATFSSVTKASGNTEVKSSSTKAKMNASSNSQELKVKTKGKSCISQSLETSGAKPKTPKTKVKPLPDTPRPNRAKDPASFCKALLGPGRDCSVSACESQFTSSSSSTSLQRPEMQRKALVNKKYKSSSSCNQKKPSASGADFVKNNKCKKPSASFSANVDSKNFVEKSKSLHGTVIEGQVSQDGNVNKEPHVEQTQLTSNADTTQESDRLNASSPSPSNSPSEHKKEPWSKKKYLLKKAAMDASVTVTMVKIPDTDSTLGSAGDAAVGQTKIRPCSATSPLTVGDCTTSPHDLVLNQQSTNFLTLCETTTRTPGSIINQEPVNPVILSRNTTAASTSDMNQPMPNSLTLRDSTNPTPAPKVSQCSTNPLTQSKNATTVSAPLIYHQPTHLLTLSERPTLAPALMVNQGPPNPVSLSEGTVPAPFSIFSLGPITPGPSWGPRPEYRFLRQTAKPKSRICGAKRRNCFLKPDPPGPKSSISQKIVTGISPASATTTSTTITSSNTSTSSSSSSSSIVEARRGPVETQFTQPSAETSVTLLGAPSKDAPQGCTSCHDYAAPSSSAPMGTDTSQDSAAQAPASDDHESPLEDLPNQASNERQRDVEENAANVPGGNTAKVPGAIKNPN